MTDSSWIDRALCKSLPLDMFTPDESLGRGVSKRLLQGASHCEWCPVFSQCESSATEDDFHWTVRAGRMPTAYVQPEPALLSRGRCSKGHAIRSMDDLAEDGLCYVCERDKAIRKREAQLAILNSLPAEGTRVCRNGHLVTKETSLTVYDRKRGKYYATCKACKAAQVAKLKKKKLAMISCAGEDS